MRILAYLEEELVILKLFNALLELNLVRILSNLLVLWHQIMLQLAFHKELQRLNKILIQLLLLFLFLCHLGRQFGVVRLRFALLRVVFFIFLTTILFAELVIGSVFALGRRVLRLVLLRTLPARRQLLLTCLLLIAVFLVFTRLLCSLLALRQGRNQQLGLHLLQPILDLQLDVEKIQG